jgi:DDE superfamily endonuclease
MEDVLAVYARPVDPLRPLICLDETGKELQADTRDPLPAKPGVRQRIDPEYQRHGSASLLLWTAPHLGKRGIRVTAQRTRREWAEAMRHLVEEQFPEAERLVVVLDNLNTHTLAALYHTYPPEIAARIAAKLELHYTPIHASWLNLAEIELSVLKRQCLHGRRVPDAATVQAQISAWAHDRNARQRGIDWHFTTADARIKLKRLYPTPVYDN